MRLLLLLLLGVALASALRENPQRIVGGSVTTITQYPFGVAILYSGSGSGTFFQVCGGTILNTRSVLSAAHCFYGNRPANSRARVGSTFANSGGIVHTINTLIIHPYFNTLNFDNDIAILRVASVISFNNNVRAGQIAGANYNLAENQVVWAIGWGSIASNGPVSEQLRHVQVWTVNQAVCRQRYAAVDNSITDNMLCSGWLDVGGRGQCGGDAGSPLLHNNVVVGIYSWGRDCGLAQFPGVNTRVSRYTSWIQSNA